MELFAKVDILLRNYLLSSWFKKSASLESKPLSKELIMLLKLSAIGLSFLALGGIGDSVVYFTCCIYDIHTPGYHISMGMI